MWAETMGSLTGDQQAKLQKENRELASQVTWSDVRWRIALAYDAPLMASDDPLIASYDPLIASYDPLIASQMEDDAWQKHLAFMSPEKIEEAKQVLLRGVLHII